MPIAAAFNPARHSRLGAASVTPVLTSEANDEEPRHRAAVLYL